MSVQNAICLLLSALLLSALSLASGAGLTVITHGLNGNADGWVTGMARQITNYPTIAGAGCTLYRIYFNYNGTSYVPAWTRIAGNAPTNTTSGEIVVAFDWSQLADGNSFTTYQIATSLGSILQTPGFISELNGHSLCELPMHLIGHSRGGSVMAETSLRLGTNGIWVDHLTTLDPHPLNNDGFTLDAFLYSAHDATVRTYETVLFHDNCWQNISFVHGESVSGAYIRHLTSLSGGYQSTGDTYYQHSNVHLWYHGTIDRRNPASDGEAQLTTTEFTNWYVPYEQRGTNAGFERSLIGTGNRTTSDQPLGPGFPAIRDGFNQAWDLGAGQASTANRTILPSHNGSWPNIIRSDIVGPMAVPVGGVVSNRYFFQYGTSTNQSATVELHLDNNSNPFDGDAGLIFQTNESSTGTNAVRSRTVSAALTNIPAGRYHMYAKVSAGTHTRYLYAPQLLFVGGPTLTFATTKTNIVFSWPTNPPGFKLQWTPNLNAGVWSNATPPPAIVNGTYTVTNATTNPLRLYRLQY